MAHLPSCAWNRISQLAIACSHVEPGQYLRSLLPLILAALRRLYALLRSLSFGEAARHSFLELRLHSIQNDLNPTCPDLYIFL